MEKLAISQLITSNKDIMTQKRSFVIVTLDIRPNQVINGTYNVGSPSIKVMIMMRA